MINVEKEIGGKVLTLETGKIARQSAGSVVLTYGETVLLVAVNAAKEPRDDVDFFPLQVEPLLPLCKGLESICAAGTF